MPQIVSHTPKVVALEKDSIIGVARVCIIPKHKVRIEPKITKVNIPLLLVIAFHPSLNSEVKDSFFQLL